MLEGGISDGINLADARCPSTLVLGAAKSGTTALFYAIREAMIRKLEKPVEGLFEPRSRREIIAYLDKSPDPAFLSKALLAPFLRGDPRLSERFERKIIIFRDPRDNVVSRILWAPQRLFRGRPAQAAEFVDLIRRKEAGPASLSICAIVRELERLCGEEGLLENFRTNAVLPATVLREQGDRYFLFPYDDMVAGQFGMLSEYLGFPVSGEFSVGEHGHVARTKGSGEWRSWFLEEDIAYFVDRNADDFALLGFDVGEQPVANPAIAPETGSVYLEKQFQRVREKRILAKKQQRFDATATEDAAAQEYAAQEALNQRRYRRRWRREKAQAK